MANLGSCNHWLGRRADRPCGNSSQEMKVRSNPRFQGTAGKLRLPVPRGLRPRAAPQAKR